jgi:ketosteroid isomerase-like protein
MKPWLVIFVGLTALTAARATEADLAAVRRADDARLQAMMAADGPALSRVLSDILVLAHADGRLESKTDYVKNLTSGGTAYADAKTLSVKMTQVTPDVIVLHGHQKMRKKLGTVWSDLDLRFMSVWRKEGDVWRMTSWQSLIPSGNSVVPAK